MTEAGQFLCHEVQLAHVLFWHAPQAAASMYAGDEQIPNQVKDNV